MYVFVFVQVTKTKWCDMTIDEKLILENAIEKAKDKLNGRDVATILGKSTYMCIRIYIHVYILTHTHTRAHTHTHIHTHTYEINTNFSVFSYYHF